MSKICDVCGLPEELCVCEEIAREVQSVKVFTVRRRFGKLTVISKSEIKKGNRVYWNCLCDCGNETIVCGSNLGRMVNSCGCIRSKNTTEIKTIQRNGIRFLKADYFDEALYGIKEKAIINV